jgi:hypothetical protein
MLVGTDSHTNRKFLFLSIVFNYEMIVRLNENTCWFTFKHNVCFVALNHFSIKSTLNTLNNHFKYFLLVILISQYQMQI